MKVKSLESSIKNRSVVTKQVSVWCMFLCFFMGLSQQEPKIKTAIDTAFIKIGEQINYTITVETDSTENVYFPEGQTFSPLETVRAIATDTTKKENRFILQKTYALTQFDSGAYTIPQQRIEVNAKPFLTDSFRIKVATITVDTLTQKMYDIKPLIAVQKGSSRSWIIVLCILGGLLILGALIYWFLWRKKPLSEEEKIALLPPYDRALLELKKLENSKYLIQDEYKEYYSQLTDIVRSYLEEDAHVSALESTTGQLIAKLEMMKDAGDLKLGDDTIKQFKQILQTADLVKFAKSKPATSVAEQDRKLVEQIVVKTHDALPEPTIEELMQQEEYQEKLEREQRRKKIIYSAAAVLGAIMLSIAGLSVYYGPKQVWDTVTFKHTKQLLEGEWITSSYGYPPLSIETPDVLKRTNGELITNTADLDTIKDKNKKKAAKDIFNKFSASKKLGISEFLMEKGEDDLYIKFEDLTLPNKDSTDLEKEAQEGIDFFAKQGRVKNIIVKREKYSTPAGAEGLKQYGTLNFRSSEGNYQKKNYIILNFAAPGNYKRLFLIWNVDDVYADKIVDRILASIEIKTDV